MNVALLARIHASSFDGAERWDEAAMATALAMPGAFALTAPDGDGMAIFRIAADEAELLTLAVAPTSRRRGIARGLLDRGMQDCALFGATCFFLEVSEANRPARALYDQLGFTEVGRRRRYYADGTTALVLRADANPGSGGAAPSGSRTEPWSTPAA